METDQLTSADIAILVAATKYFVNHPELYPLVSGKFRRTEVIVDKLHNLGYKLQIYRGNVENKYSLHIRFSANNQQVLRLCINGSRHHNQDGTLVGRSHVHVYRPENQESYAHTLTAFPFIENDNLTTAITKFVAYINLKLAGVA